MCWDQIGEIGGRTVFKPSWRKRRFEKPSSMQQRISKKAAGGVLTAKQAPHRPGAAPALGLRAGIEAAVILQQTAFP
jgi:hypothetical protein